MSKNKKTEKRIKPIEFELKESHFILILAGLILIIYGRTLGYDLVYCDDHEIILTLFNRIQNIGNIFGEFFRGYMTTDYYRPLINASFVVNAAIGGQNPMIYHLTNILIHFTFCWALYLFLREMKFDKFTSIAGSLFYAVHPLMVNSVAWIVGRNDMIFSIFLLLSFIFYLRYNENTEKSGNGYLLGFSVSFLLALLSKETALVFPFLVLTHLLINNRKDIISKKYLKLAAILLLPIAVYFFFRSISTLGSPAYVKGFFLFENIRTIPEFFAKFIFPLKIEVLATYSMLNTVIGLIALAGLIFLIFKTQKNVRPVIWFGLIWFLIFTIPSLLAKNPDSNDWNEYLECRAYFSMIGILLVLLELFGFSELNIPKKRIYAFLFTVLILFGAVSYVNTSNYKDAESYYEKAVKDNPDKARFHLVLAKVYAKNQKYDLAEVQLKDAINSNPKYGFYTYSLATFYNTLNRIDEAISVAKKALLLDSNGAVYYGLLVNLGIEKTDYSMAEEYCLKGLSKKPNDDNLNYYMMKIELIRDRIPQADKIAQKLRSSGFSQQLLADVYNSKALLYMKADKDETAIDLLNKAVAIDSSHYKALNNLFVYYFQKEPDYEKAYHLSKLLQARGINIKKTDMKFLEEKAERKL